MKPNNLISYLSTLAWRPCSREGHGGGVAESDFEYSITWLAFIVALGLNNADVAPFVSYRTETFAARRAGGAVQSVSAEANNTALLRFFGWQAAAGTARPLRLSFTLNCTYLYHSPQNTVV